MLLSEKVSELDDPSISQSVIQLEHYVFHQVLQAIAAGVDDPQAVATTALRIASVDET